MENTSGATVGRRIRKEDGESCFGIVMHKGPRLIRRGFVKATLFLLLLLFTGTWQAAADSSPSIDPFSCQQSASQFASSASAGQVAREINQLVVNAPASTRQDAIWNCYVAELMKRVGNYRASEYYEKAIELDPNEAAYELFYGDYLRLHRGARSPLFGRAEKHYFRGLEKARRSKAQRAWEPVVEDRLNRGLVDLYQRDGLTIGLWPSNRVDSHETLSRPFASLASTINYAFASDVPTGIDVRDLTSSAAFSAGRTRKHQSLSNQELSGLIRAVEPLDVQPRVRFRYGEFPAVDFLYDAQTAAKAQVTNFFSPNQFNGVKLYQFQVAAQEPFSVGRGLDATISASFERSKRVGVIEFSPTAPDVIHTYQAGLNLARNLGPDRLLLDFVWAHQGIDPRPYLLERGRDFEGFTLTYQIYRPLRFLHRSLESSYTRVFETRGIDLYGGVLNDRETFNDSNPADNVIDHRRDTFFGVAAKGLGRFDVTVQPTFYSFRTNFDPPENNSQYRTFASVLTRLRDEEQHQGMPKNGRWGLAFLHLVVPLTHDVPHEGLDNFANFKLGAELDAKWITTDRVTILGTARYDFQDFYKLGRQLHLFKLGVSMGF